jgi:hypothetical protein
MEVMEMVVEDDVKEAGNTPMKIVRPSRMELDRTVDLFDGARKNRLGDDYCVMAAIQPEEVDRYWDLYLDYLCQLQEIRHT